MCWQDVVNVLVRNCSANFFIIPLPGSTILMLDMIHAASVVLSLPHDYQNFNRHPVDVYLLIAFISVRNNTNITSVLLLLLVLVLLLFVVVVSGMQL